MASSNTDEPNTDFVEDESDYDWENYKKKFGKSYSPEEEPKRKELFLKTVEEVKKQNALYREGKSTFYAGINHFADLTSQEKGIYCGARIPKKKH